MTQQPVKAPTPSVYDQLMKSRTIWLGEDVRDDNANEICSKLLVLSAQDPEADIYLYINSPGGSVTAGCAIHDTMQLIPNDVVVIGFGMCASMGQFLLTAGAPGKRFATPLLRVLLHQPLGGYQGMTTDVELSRKLINDMKHTLASITAKNTGHSVEKVIEDGDRDNWFTAKEALEYNFVDHVIANDFNEVKAICAQVDAAKAAKDTKKAKAKASSTAKNEGN